ncbi:MAG TPA: hypothetical protein VM261_04050 [Kofleriaceae bacterium]|nr:hypothetical protein [Kofleriaceae bacterium]
MYDLRRGDEEQPRNEGSAGVAAGKRAPTDRLEARPGVASVAGLVPPPSLPPVQANHVEDPARDPFVNDDPFGLHLLGPKRVTTDVNVRSSPAIAADNRVAGYPSGHIVDVVARHGEWALVMHEGRPAYVHGKYLVDAPAAAAAPKPAKPAAKPSPMAMAPFEDHTHDQLVTLARQSGNPQASSLADELLAAAALQQRAPKGKGHARDGDRGKSGNVGKNEEEGADRAALVQRIASLRQGIAALPDELAALKAGFYRAVQDIAPYYQQWNENYIATETEGGTCNITSFAMALESLGKTAASYTGNPAHLLAAARAMIPRPMDLEKLKAMRLPDFMQIAYVAHFMTNDSPAALAAARNQGFNSLTDGGVMARVATHFGAHGEYHLRDDATVLRAQGNAAFGKSHRRAAMIELGRKRRDGDGDLETVRARYGQQMDVAVAEKKLPIEAYRSWVQTTIGGELGSGAAIVMGMGGGGGHFVRVQAVHDDHMVMDDPGNWKNANLKVTYEEARAMGAFWNRIVITG